MTRLRSVILLLACAPALQAQDRVIGLLSLPDVFGNEPCQRFVAREVPLYAEPDEQRRIGSIRVDRPWTFPPEGGCEGLQAGVHLTDPPRHSALPTEEYDYEAPGALVLEAREDWFKVRLSEGAAWVRASRTTAFHPLQRLLGNYPTHLTGAFDGRLAATAGGALSIRSDSLAGRSINVGEFREIGGRLWIKVEVVSWSLCESEEKPKVLARGWLPAHAPSGEPSVWFSSRGC